MTDTPIHGGCLCGASRYRSDGAPMNVRACHCHRCQKTTGAAFYARIMVPLNSLTIDGPVGWFSAESGIRRGFCTQCGTTLFSERQSANTIGLAMGSLDQPDRFTPTEHILARLAEMPMGSLVYVFGHGQFIQAARSIVMDAELDDSAKMRAFWQDGAPPIISNAQLVGFRCAEGRWLQGSP